MARSKFLLALIVLGVAALVMAQTPIAAYPAGQAAAPASTPLRILQPTAGVKLAQNFVEVQFELTNPSATTASTPNFVVQLDNRDPVNTASTTQSFTGLTPGQHTLTVQVVDANNTPIAGLSASVRFTTVDGSSPAQPAPGQTLPPTGQTQPPSGMSLRGSGSVLPLISVIGFGVLLGGIVSAMKTR